MWNILTNLLQGCNAMPYKRNMLPPVSGGEKKEGTALIYTENGASMFL
jgi:hypothetical protein